MGLAYNPIYLEHDTGDHVEPEVPYFSTHEYPFYPGTGWMDETGMGEGEGTTINFPKYYI